MTIWWNLLRAAIRNWLGNNPWRLGAALAYYMMFSLAPLVLLSLTVASWTFGEEAARGEVKHHLQAQFGDSGAEALQEVMAVSRRQTGSNLLAAIVGLATLLFAASGVFYQLKDAFNVIWKVEPRPGLGIASFLKNRILALLMVLCIAGLLLLSLAVSATLAAIDLRAVLGNSAWLSYIADVSTSTMLVTLLFAVIYKAMPDAPVAWSDVWLGALGAALLFTLAKFGLGFYLGYVAPGSSYGAAGSIIVVMLWVYYSAQILFLGAEFTREYALARGSRRNSI